MADSSHALPAVQRKAFWVPTIRGQARPSHGLFETRSEAIRIARDQLDPGRHHLAGARRAWLAVEER